jgi:hypothetical protein
MASLRRAGVSDPNEVAKSNELSPLGFPIRVWREATTTESVGHHEKINAI